jgi:hypothetical protein
MEVIEVPAALEATCFVCPKNSSPDDYVDFHALWQSLCEIASTRRFSSHITAQRLAESMSLNRVFIAPTSAEPKPDGLVRSNSPTAVSSSSNSSNRTKRSVDVRENPECEVTVNHFTSIRHASISLTRHPERGREFVCTAKEGFAAGVCVLVEDPLVSVLDTEVQREKEWWDLDGADTCSLFLCWMELLLKTTQTHEDSENSAGASAPTQKEASPPAARRMKTSSGSAPAAPSSHTPQPLNARAHTLSANHDHLLAITNQLHPAPPPGGSSEAEWKVLSLLALLVQKY